MQFILTVLYTIFYKLFIERYFKTEKQLNALSKQCEDYEYTMKSLTDEYFYHVLNVEGAIHIHYKATYLNHSCYAGTLPGSQLL